MLKLPIGTFMSKSILLNQYVEYDKNENQCYFIVNPLLCNVVKWSDAP